MTVDRADPTRLRVRWDELPSHQELAHEQADQIAAAVNAQSGPQGWDAGAPQGWPNVTPGGAQGWPNVTPGPGATPADVATAQDATARMIAALQQAFPGAQIQMEGATVDGQPLQVPGQPAGTTPPAPAPPVDRVALLERLAKLREQGLLTDAEFQTEKARILNEP